MVRILVADKLDPRVIEDARGKDNVEVDVKLGLSEDQLRAEVGNYDGMIVRSGVKVTARVLSSPGRLRAIARAGVGVDNVDLDAATRAGVLVMNTPDANTISTAEHTFAVMLALMRKVVPACLETKSANWERSRFVGNQLAGKILGIVGLGRVGRAVAERALAFQMTVWGYDPLFPQESTLKGRVKLVHDLDELLKNCDILTIHASLTDQTRGLINRDRLVRMKPTACIVNCARGGIVDEDALYDALKAGKLAGVALDVYSQEPPGKLPLFELDNVVATCHLGASTKEAQLAVAHDAVDALVDYLTDGNIRSAVNVADLPATISDVQRSFVDLARRMAALISLTVHGGIKSVQVTATGDALAEILPFLLRSALVELLGHYLETSINVVNAELLAQSTGIETSYSSKSSSEAAPDRLRIDVTADDGVHWIVGTAGPNGAPLILEIDGYRMQMVPDGIMVILFNDDLPGVIGLVGTTFGKHKVNIADLTLSRKKDRALMVFKIDAPAPPEAIEQLRKACPPIRRVETAQLPPIDRPNEVPSI